MWIKSHSKVMKSVNKKAIWECWSDVNSWHEWVPGVEYCHLEKPFQNGSRFTLKPKGSPAVTVQLADVEKDQQFTGCTRFFGATMYDTHEMHETTEGIRMTVTLKVTGPLGFLWRMLVAEKIADNLPALMKNLANVASAPMPKKDNPRTSERKKPNLHLITPTPKKTKPKPAASALKKAKREAIAPTPKKAALQPKPGATAVKKPKLKTTASTPKKGKPKLKDLAAKKMTAKPKASAPKKAKAQSKPESKR